MFNVLVKGFKTQKHAQMFVDWYCGQGEQDSDIWFESNGNCTGYNTDLSHPEHNTTDKDGNLVMVVIGGTEDHE